MMRPMMGFLFAAAAGLVVAQDGYPPTESSEMFPCDLRAIEKMSYCASCERFDPPLDARGRCDICGKEISNVDVCVKKAHQCIRCGRMQAPPGKCRDLAMREVTARSLVIFKCAGCGTIGEKEGACVTPSCRAAGRKVVRTCRHSGLWPHGGQEPPVRSDPE